MFFVATLKNSSGLDEDMRARVCVRERRVVWSISGVACIVVGWGWGWVWEGLLVEGGCDDVVVAVVVVVLFVVRGRGISLDARVVVLEVGGGSGSERVATNSFKCVTSRFSWWRAAGEIAVTEGSSGRLCEKFMVVSFLFLRFLLFLAFNVVKVEVRLGGCLQGYWMQHV